MTSGLELLLHVEDDALISRSVIRLLKAWGFQLISVPSCASARALSDTFRVGIFDIDLPDGDGIALAREFLERGVCERVVFFTATGDPQSLAQASELGIVLLKASGVEALRAAVGVPGQLSEHPPDSRVKGPAKANAS